MNGLETDTEEKPDKKKPEQNSGAQNGQPDPGDQPSGGGNLKSLYNGIKQGGAANLPAFEKFQQDMQNPQAQRGLYKMLKEGGAKNLPAFEKFQADLFGTPSGGNEKDQPIRESGKGVPFESMGQYNDGSASKSPRSDSGQEIELNPRFYRQQKIRQKKFKERAEKLNKKAQAIEDKAYSNMVRVPGAPSIPDPGMRKKAFELRQERNRLLEQADSAQQKILDKLDTGQSRLESGTNSFVRGLVNTLGEQTMKSAAIGGTFLAKKMGDLQGEDTSNYNPEEHPWYKQGEEFGNAVREMFPNNPKFQQEFVTNTLATGAGTMAGYLAAGVAGKGLRAAGLSGNTAKYLTSESISSGLLGSATISAQEFDRAMEETGGNVDKAFNVWLANIPVGMTEAVPVGKFFRKLNTTTGGGVASVLADATEQGFTELTQEVGQQYLSNFSGQQLVDKTRELTEGVAEGGAAGFLLGALMGGAGRAIANARANAQNETQKSKADQAAELLNKAREDIGSVEIKRGKPKSIRPEARISYDPEAAPTEQINQLKAERERILSEKEKAEEAGEDAGDFEGLVENVNEMIALIQEGARADRAQSETKSEETTPNEPPSEPAREAGLTKRGQDFLTRIDAPEAPTPQFVTREMEAVAKENGVDVTESTKPEDITEGLRAKQAERAPARAEQQKQPELAEGDQEQPDIETAESPESEPIGQEIEGDIQGEYSDSGVSVAARDAETGTVFTAPRNEVATHPQLNEKFDLDPERVEMGFISPEGRFLNRNETTQYQQQKQPGFEPSAPNVAFAEDVIPRAETEGFTTADGKTQVRQGAEGLQVQNIETEQDVEPGSPGFDSAVAEFIASETADAGKANRPEGQDDINFLRSVAENSSNPVQLAEALQTAQDMQEGSQDSETQNRIRDRFEEVTGVPLSPQMAEKISARAEANKQSSNQSRPELAAMRGSKEATVGQKLGDNTGYKVTPDMVLAGVDGGRFFGDTRAMRELKSDQSPLSRTTVVYMSPQEYLNMAAPVNEAYDQESLQYQKQQIKKGKKLDGLPHLRIGEPSADSAPPGAAQVEGHEGRHRAKALADAGVNKMPVRITHRTKRWGNSKGRPTTLIGEDGDTTSNADNQMAMPESIFYPQDVDARNSQSAGNPDSGGPEIQGLRSRSEMGTGTSAGTATEPLAGAPEPEPNINEDWDIPGQGIRDIVEDLVKSTGSILRQGRMTLNEALGQYSRRSGVIRTNVRDALDVVTHEVAHSMEDQYGGELNALKTLHKDEVSELSYPGVEGDQQLSEGFAEFFRLYITAPGHAENAAPNFYGDFEAWLKDLDNSLYEDLQRIRGKLQVYIKQPSGNRVGSAVVSAKTKIEEWTQKIKDEGPWGIFTSKMGQLYRATIGGDDSFRIARDYLLDLHYENTGKNYDLAPDKDMYMLQRIANDSYAAGAADIEHGVENAKTAEAEGPSLRDAMHFAMDGDWSKGKIKSFNDYLVSRRAVHEWDRFNEGKLPNWPTQHTRPDHELNIKTLEAKYPEFKAAADMVNEYTGNLFRKLRDAGFVGDEMYNRIKKEHPFYVPFFRDMSDKSFTESGSQTDQSLKRGPLQRQEGSTRPILAPIEQIMKMSYEYNMLVKKNAITQGMYHLQQKAGPGSGKIIEEIPATQAQGLAVNTKDVLKKLSETADWEAYDAADALGKLLTISSMDNIDLPDMQFYKQGELNERGEPIVYTWIDGKRKAMRLGDDKIGMEMYQEISQTNKRAQDLFVNTLAYPASVLRAGVTTSPSFFVANVIRDQVSAWILTDVGVTPFISLGQDLTQRTKETLARNIENYDSPLLKEGAMPRESQREYSRLYRTHSGISTFNVAALDENRAKAEVKKLKQKNIPLRRLLTVRGMNELLDLSEIGTRLAVFQRANRVARDRGMTKKQAAVYAGYMARDLIDFGRHGSKLAFTRRLFPFFNAALQGSDKGYRVLTGEGAVRRKFFNSKPGEIVKTILPFLKDVSGRPLNQREQENLSLSRKAWSRVMSLGMVGASLTLMYADDPEYDEIPDYLKDTHWMFRNPFGKSSDGELSEWVAIPKPFELAFISNVAENVIMSYKNENPEWGETIHRSLWEVIAPPLSATGIQVPTEVWANKRQFDDRPIVYEHLKGMDEYKQYSAYTSDFSKWMSKQLYENFGRDSDVSPMIIDHVIKGTFGTWGRTILSATSSVPKGAPTEGAEDRWVVRRFLRSADRGNNSTREFWEQVNRDDGEMTSALGTFEHEIKAGTPGDAFDFYRKLQPHEQLYVAMNHADDEDKQIFPFLDAPHPLDNAKSALSILSKLRTDVREGNDIFEDMAPDDKRKADDLLDRMGTIETRNAMIASQKPNYKSKPPMDIGKMLNKIRTNIPLLYREMNIRYNSSGQPLNPTKQYGRFTKIAQNQNLSDKITSIMELKEKELEQKRKRK